ncbi:hypothetical protein HAX54_046229, partial [Datura stramonium]|nr:hypothetical protein [Datura stramonium]
QAVSFCQTTVEIADNSFNWLINGQSWNLDRLLDLLHFNSNLVDFVKQAVELLTTPSGCLIY